MILAGLDGLHNADSMLDSLISDGILSTGCDRQRFVATKKTVEGIAVSNSFRFHDSMRVPSGRAAGGCKLLRRKGGIYFRRL
jgi:hypothetical protein